ncbi:hypothetical protein ACS0TY_022307 [Phlomoides rotata]
MVGGGNRRDEASFTVSNTNVFAALESLRKKKKSDKDKGSSRGGKGTSKAANSEAEKQIYWAPAPLTVKSWADVDDEDDDDYYATTAPPQAIWGGSGVNAEETHKPDIVEESESEDDLLDEEDDDVDEAHDQEPEVEDQHEPLEKKPVEPSPAPKETERQLSKKERKKKELAELEAILADFGVNPKEKAEDEPSDVSKDGELNGNADKKDNPPVESKTAKKKKKKDKASKEVQPNNADVPNGQHETAATEHVEEDASAVDVKERLKKVASMKKKKSSKEMDSGARAATIEAAARSARLAAAKKKEKNHYNQQPMR